jgi:hypothetical protein
MKPSFEISADVEKLVAFLSERERASYSEMSSLVGRRLNARDRYVLTSARRILENTRGIIFETERGVGIVRATNGQIADLATSHPINTIKRLTRRAQKRQTRVNIQDLTADERLAFAIGRVVLNAVGKTTLKSFRQQIAHEIERRDGELVSVQQVVSLPRLKTKT